MVMIIGWAELLERARLRSLVLSVLISFELSSGYSTFAWKRREGGGLGEYLLSELWAKFSWQCG